MKQQIVTKNCLSRWDPIGLQCLQCTYTKNNVNLSFILGKTKKTFRYNLDNTPDDDSSVLRSLGVTIDYFEIGGILGQIEIVTTHMQTLDIKSQNLSYDSQEYSNLNCPGYSNINMKRTTFILNPTKFDRLSISFIRPDENHIIAISKLRIWVNCMTNCELCYNYQKCLRCMQGFNLYTIDQDNSVCETNTCNVQNCDKCPFNMPDKCTSCKPGFIYDDKQKQCINNSSKCGVDQYFDLTQNQCRTYSKKCYYYSEVLQEYEECSGIDIKQYKCPENTFILFYGYLTEGQNVCGCTIQSCYECNSFSSCIKCNEGTKYVESLNKCVQEVVDCPKKQYSENSPCIPCPSQCNSDKCCDGCSDNRETSLSIYSAIQKKCIDASCNQGQYLDTKMRQCVCKIENCVECYLLDKCDECKIGYQFNNTTKKCEIKICNNPNEYYNKSEDECLICGIKCSKCGKDSCQECINTNEYVIDNKNPKNCKRICGPNCGECNLEKECTKCISSSYIFSNTDNTSCIECKNCSQCNQSTKKCDKCIADNYYSNQTTDCTKCDDSCNQCTETECLQCKPKPGFNVSIDKTQCVTCSLGCSSCNSNQCLRCEKNDTYFDPNNQKNCKQCADNCLKCDQVTGECLDCKNGYYPDPLNNNFNCKLCENNCESCDKTQCKTCKSGFFIDKNNLKNCKYCNEFCIQNYCDIINSQCTKCMEGYYIDLDNKDQCMKCGNYCSKCSSLIKCEECVNNQYYIKNGENSCIPCEANCQTCSQEECLTCKSNQYRRNINNPKECISCDSSCLTCSNDKCIQCKEQNAVSTKNEPHICKKCIENCEQCDADVNCLSCKSGYYLNSEKQCVKCENNCNKCTNSECTVCSQGFYQNPNLKAQCSQCGSKCKSCNQNQCQICDSESGYTRLDQNNPMDCQKCGQYCSTCDFQTGDCKSCQDPSKYFINSDNKKECITCGDNCQTCDHNNLKCIQCKLKYYLKSVDSKNCFPCGNDCVDCDETSCITCPNKFSKDPEYPMNCIPCGQNCQLCDFNSNKCTKCNQNYYSVGPIFRDCNQCGDKCDECEENKCLKCKTGLYGRDPKDIKNCIQCGENCTQCKFEDSSCQICKPGYYVKNSTSIDCSICGDNCQNCDAINKCTQCKPKYFAELPDKFNCLPCSNTCDECDGIQCTKCNSDYPSLQKTNKMNCVKCDLNCKICDLTNQTCTTCNDGYYQDSIDPTKCMPCGEKCKKCNSEQCIECYENHSSLDPEKQKNCIKCDDDCLSCDFNSNECNKCKDGFYANKRVCVQCGEKCNKCSSSSQCDSCDPNFPSLDPDETRNCIVCDSNCQTCDYTNNQCQKCIEGYIIDPGNNRKCLKCGNKCIKCSNLSQCDTCDPDFPSLDPTTSKMNCIKCDQNCKQCNYQTNECNECKDGYYKLPSIPRECQKCGPHCNKCTNLQCTECEQNFPSLNPQNYLECLPCGSNCKTCNINSFKCITCNDNIPNYSLDQDNKRNCKSCGFQCTSCDFETGVCKQCPDGYYLPSIKSIDCIQCGNNCNKCDKDGCKECHSNFPRIDPNDKLGCLACEKNCLQCDIFSPKCITCKQDFPSLNPQNKANCVALGSNCLKSDFETAECQICKDNTYFVDPANKLQCRTCGSNCFECNKVDASCKICNVLHYKKPGNIEDCYPCGSNCKECDESGCKECVTENVYKDPRSPFDCKQCEENCVKCNNEQCTQCKEENSIKYFKDPKDSKKCRTCHKSCLNCDSNTAICKECPPAMFQNPNNNEECLPCTENCSQCSSSQCLECVNDTFYIKNSNAKLCVPCEKGCKRCSKLECKECIDTIKTFPDPQNIQECRACHPSCNICDFKTGECLTCPDQTYKNNQECLPCPKGCSSCNAQNQCTKCIKSNQFYSIDNNECLDCYENCLVCSSTECMQCNTENLFQDPQNKFKCRTCGTNCKVCDKNTAECIECLQDNYFISLNKQDCQPCSQDSCQKCRLSGQTQECLQCQKGYYKILNICKTCGENCLDCESSDYCKICENGFTRNENQKIDCIKCSENCIKCDREKCIQCQEMFIKDKENQQNCIQCDPSCRECTSKECLKCSDSYPSFIDPNKPSRCITCDEPALCLECNKKSIAYNLKFQNKNQKFIIFQNNKNYFHYQIEPSECEKCIDGYKVNKLTKKCEFECKAPNCNQCYQLNAYECNECKTNYYLNRSNRVCTEITESNKNSFTVTNRLLNDGYEIKITFEKTLQVNKEDLQSQIQNFIEFKLDNTSALYQSQFLQSENNELIYKIIPKSDVKKSKLSIQFKNQKFMSDNSVNNEQETIELQPYVIVQQAQLEASQNAKEAGEKVSQAASSSIIPLSMVGNFYIITNTIDYTGFLYLLLITNIRFPKNVLQFYSVFQDFQFPMIPNIFLSLVNSDYYQETPLKFQTDKQDSVYEKQDAYFLKNAGQSITIMIGIVTIYIVLKIISFIPIKYLQPYLKKALSNTWEYSAFFDLLYTVYLNILIGSYLQFYSFDNGDKSSSAINYILFTVFIIQSFGLPFILTFFMYKQHDIGSDKIFQRKYNTLLGGLNIQSLQKNKYTQSQQENTPTKLQEIKTKNQIEMNHKESNDQSDITLKQNSDYGSREIFLNRDTEKKHRKNSDEDRKLLSIKYCKYYYPVLYFRKALFGLFIVYFCDYPILQLVLVSGLSIGVSIYLWFIQPFTSKIENIKTIIWEYFMVAIYMTSGFLVEDKEDESEDNRFKIGWVIIGFTSILLGINTLLIIYSLLKSIIQPLYKFIQKKINSKKQKNSLQDYKTPSTNNLIPQTLQIQNLFTNQNNHSDVKKSSKQDSTPLSQLRNQEQPNSQFKRKKIRIPSQISHVSGDNKDILSENFSFIMESDPASLKQIRVFDYKPSNPSLIEGIKSHRPSNSDLCIQQIEFNSQNHIGQRTPLSQKTPSSKNLISPFQTNIILETQKSQSLIQNKNQ